MSDWMRYPSFRLFIRKEEVPWCGQQKGLSGSKFGSPFCRFGVFLRSVAYADDANHESESVSVESSGSQALSGGNVSERFDEGDAFSSELVSEPASEETASASGTSAVERSPAQSEAGSASGSDSGALASYTDGAQSRAVDIDLSGEMVYTPYYWGMTSKIFRIGLPLPTATVLRLDGLPGCRYADSCRMVRLQFLASGFP